jgi:hypothetical protein
MAGPHSPEASERAGYIVEFLCSRRLVGTVILDGEDQLQRVLTCEAAPESIRREFPVKRQYGYSPALSDVLRTMVLGGQLSMLSSMQSYRINQGAHNIGRTAADRLSDDEKDYLTAAANQLRAA